MIVHYLANEWAAKGINVNAIAPGQTMSEANLKRGEETDAHSLRLRLLKRRLFPEDGWQTHPALGFDLGSDPGYPFSSGPLPIPPNPMIRMIKIGLRPPGRGRRRGRADEYFLGNRVFRANSGYVLPIRLAFVMCCLNDRRFGSLSYLLTL